MSRLVQVILTLLLLIFSTLCHADLDVVVEPGYAKQGDNLGYGSLVRYLDKAIPESLSLSTPATHHHHWKAIQSEELASIMIEPAHITSYLIEFFDYRPLYTLTGDQRYQLVVRKDSQYRNSRDLSGTRVVTLPGPSMGYLALNQWYRDPMSQPVIETDLSSWQDCLEQVRSGAVAAAVVPNHLAKDYTDLKVLRSTRPMPGLTLSINPDLDAEVTERIINAVNWLAEQENSAEVLEKLGLESVADANTDEYKNWHQALVAQSIRYTTQAITASAGR